MNGIEKIRLKLEVCLKKKKPPRAHIFRYFRYESRNNNFIIKQTQQILHFVHRKLDSCIFCYMEILNLTKNFILNYFCSQSKKVMDQLRSVWSFSSDKLRFVNKSFVTYFLKVNLNCFDALVFNLKI